MTEVLCARQPIFDTDLSVMGFELFFREAGGDSAEMVDGSTATSQVVLKTFSSLDTQALLGGKPAHVNLSDAFLRSGQANTLPAEQVVLDLTGDLRVDDELERVVKRLVSVGYTVGLEDCLQNPSLQRLLPYAQFAKVNVDGHVPADVLAQLQAAGCGAAVPVAMRIESHEMFEACRDAGFQAFQGYFLSRPRPMVGQVATANRTTLMRLLAVVNAPEIDLREVEALVRTDVGMSYRLLRLINSAYYQVPREVQNIRQAIGLMGVRQLRQWLSLMALAGIDTKPPAVFQTALVRARMAERLAEMAGEHEVANFFVAGLFSSLDALMDRELEDVLSQLPLADVLTAALLQGEGVLGEAVACVLAQERCQLHDVSFGELDPWAIQDAYLDAVGWASDIAAQVTAKPAPAPA